jgi:beta-N-acetylhexosaminidase
MKNKIGQLMMIGVSGLVLTDDEKKFIVENNISGVTLFGRNCKDPKQIYDLCNEIQSLHKLTVERTPLYIAVDMEGGRVARLKAPFTQWPPMKKVGDKNSPTLSYELAHAMGNELRTVGINVDWAPSVDVLTNSSNPVIGDRAFSDDAEVVAKLASAQIRGFLKAEVIPCVKHFPGHGNTMVDSHEDLPIESLDMERLEKIELIPFIKTFKSKVDMVMTSHILFKNIDADNPVTFSKLFLDAILRSKLKYKGLVVSDDLGMKALAKYHDVKKIPVKALQAGVDVLLYCNEPTSPPLALEALAEALAKDELSPALVSDKYGRILEHKKKHLKNTEPNPWDDISKIIGCQDHLLIAKTFA